jgi:hypothetical protein
LLKALDKTTLTSERRGFVANSVASLDALYSSFRQTNASRCGDQIARIVQSILRELEACSEARSLDPKFRTGLHLLHEELGIPKLALKPAPKPLTKKLRAK